MMLELGIYKDFKLQGVIKSYIGLTWIRRFNDVGEFILKIAPIKENIDLIKSGDIITKGSEAAFIENIESEHESNKRAIVIITGRFLSRVLNQRIISLTMNGQTDTVINALLSQNFISAQDTRRRIGNLAIKNLTTKNAISANIDWENRNSLECIRELTQNAVVGFKVDFNIKDKAFDFSLYDGKKSMAIFTETYRNILRQDYLYETRDYKNTLYLRSGDAIHIFGVENEGINRREMFAAISTNNPDPLADQAKSILNRHSIIESLDSVVNMASEQFVYRRDWDLGDIVKNHSTFWGVTIEKNVLEVREYYEGGKLSLSLVFGDLSNYSIERRVK